MSGPNEETPGGESRGSNTLQMERAESILPRIGHTVDALLEQMVWRLVNGELGLHDFSPAFQTLWCLAADQGRASATRDEVDRLTWERDLWYACYANGWTPGEYMRRHTEALWAEGVAA